MTLHAFAGQHEHDAHGPPAGDPHAGGGPIRNAARIEPAAPAPHIAAGHRAHEHQARNAGGDAPIPGHHFLDAQKLDAGNAFTVAGQRLREAQPNVARDGDLDLAVARLVRHHRRDAAWRRIRMGLQQRAGAAIRAAYGFSTFAPEKERAAAIRQAAKAVRAWAKGECAPGLDLETSAALAMGWALAEEQAAPWLVLEAAEQKVMIRIARTLPGYGWVKSVRGFGDLSFARVVAELGEPVHHYRGVAALWKRLGLAVVAGERQRRKANAEEAAAHGYSPGRRSVVWNALGAGSGLLRSQIRAAPADPETGEVLGEAEALGEFGEVYLRTRAIYRERVHTSGKLTGEHWSKGHAHNAACRRMEKHAIARLWQAWRHDLGLAGRETGETQCLGARGAKQDNLP